jgi:hypothetical protein
MIVFVKESKSFRFSFFFKFIKEKSDMFLELANELKFSKIAYKTILAGFLNVV